MSENGATYPGLQDRPVLISGGATGIGAAIVSEFVRQGAKVAFVDVNAEEGETLVSALVDKGAKHKPVFRTLDLRDLEAIEAAVPELAETIGGIGALVNNAANDDRHTLEQITPEYWRDRLAVNLDHQVFMAKAAAPYLERAQHGAIINMGSCSWRIGLSNLTAYVTAKAAIEGLTNGLARELGPKGVRVNCVIPGAIRTQRQIDKWLTPEAEKVIMDGQCLKEPIDPVYVAHMVTFLASDNARMCTSGTYTVDAGWI